MKAHGYAAYDASSPLRSFEFQRREPGPDDVVIHIDYCGVCHSDLHQVRNEWGNSTYPLVPGHEIVGRVLQTGKAVTRFKAGDHVGVGCLVNSCRTCASCRDGEEQYCLNGSVGTYNSYEKGSSTPTYGGYSDQIVVTQDFVVRLPTNLPLAGMAPLLCAGITTYSPLRHWQVGPDHTVGVVGLGGLGHMGVKFARAFGCKVVVLTHSEDKAQDALRLGAHDVLVTKNPDIFTRCRNQFDFLLDTVSAPHNLNQYLQLLRRDGHMVLVGLPETPTMLHAFPLVLGRRSLAGSLIGGIRETQEMLDFCGEQGITSDVEIIAMAQIDRAYERMVAGDVKYRFVIDMKSL